MKKRRNITLICFDIDGTLTPGVSWHVLTKRLGCSIETHTNIYHQARRKEISVPTGSKLLVKMWRKSGNANRQHIEKILREIPLRSSATHLIQNLKKKGYMICIISGAIDSFVASTAKKLGVDKWYAQSSLAFNKKGMLTKINWSSNQGKVKVKQLRTICKRLKLDIRKNVACIGDGENDIGIFKATGHGIAVHSKNETLKKVARKVADSLKQIEKFL